MFKLLINILFLFVLGATALPVKQVGKLIHSNQLQEEKNEGASENVTVMVKFMAKDLMCLHDGGIIHFLVPVTNTLPSYFRFGHGPLLCPPVDIHCPPPNIATV